MSHGGSDIDFDSILRKELPPPFCAGRWRGFTGVAGAVALLILIFSVEERYARGSGDRPDEVERVAPPIAVSSASAAAWTPAVLEGGPSPQATALEDPGLRYVAGVGGTPFNTAAASVRPAVVGVRGHGPSGLRPGMHRVGSGLIVDPRGYVVTCRHVIGDATSITVSRFRRADEQLPARLAGVQGDLALLQVLADGPFEVAPLGDSSLVRVGDWVLAIGHPFGLGLTVTAGIVGRTDAYLATPGGGRSDPVIQTDAPINEGSSGGPLVDLDGRVVGLSTAIYAPTGVFSGAGFAIPSNDVRALLARHLPDSPAAQLAPAARAVAGAVRNDARWGVGLRDLTPVTARELGFPAVTGALVTEALPGSGAAAAGLVPGDVLVAIDGAPVGDVGAADRGFARARPQGMATLEVWRRGRSETVIVTLSR